MPFEWFVRLRRSRKTSREKEFRSAIQMVSPVVPPSRNIISDFLAFLAQRSRPGDPAASLDLLTLRERQVASLAAQGYTNKEMADQLDITEDTVKVHMRSIRSKLGVRSKAELRQFWADRNWRESGK